MYTHNTPHRREDMHRLQVMVTEEHYAWLKERARASGKSISQVIRELLDEAEAALSRSVMDDPFWDIVGMARGDDPYAGVEHDRHIYADRRE